MASSHSVLLCFDWVHLCSDEALQEQKDSDRAVHTVVKEQMHKLRHDFLSKFQATAPLWYFPAHVLGLPGLLSGHVGCSGEGPQLCSEPPRRADATSES